MTKDERDKLVARVREYPGDNRYVVALIAALDEALADLANERRECKRLSRARVEEYNEATKTRQAMSKDYREMMQKFAEVVSGQSSLDDARKQYAELHDRINAIQAAR